MSSEAGRLSMLVAEVVEAELASYIGEQFRWEWCVMPMMTEQGPRLGMLFSLYCRSPILTEGWISCESQNPDVMGMTNAAAVRTVLDHMVGELRRARDERLRALQ